MLGHRNLSGPVTFLFTDIEGSTKLWEDHPEQMRESLAKHDELVRHEIERFDGHVFKTVGDAFCAAFSAPASAAAAALACQTRIQSAPWPEETPLKVRMSLHTGAVETRDDDYFGPPINRVARLLSICHGDQIVISAATKELIGDALPEGVVLQDCGLHLLKDLDRPEGVFLLHHPDLTVDPRPLRSLTYRPTNLTPQLTAFIGRETLIAEIKSMLSHNRLVTLTGAGGCGKTRLAKQTSAELLDAMEDGVWVVELSTVSDGALVPAAVAGVLGLKEQPGKNLSHSLVEFLRHRRMLIVVDNCEHVLDDAAELIGSILREAPKILVLATSREALGIEGEQKCRIASLDLPDEDASQSVDTLCRTEAVRLFLDRARLHQSNFAVTDDNAQAIARICRRLDGIPLAIELAAARVTSLSAEDIEQRLDQRFRLLSGGSRTALPRQRTLQSLFDWSYDLLTGPEQALFVRLSVFAGGWTLDLCESICSGEPIEGWEVLDLLSSLCEKSLVIAEEEGGSIRYRLLESVREYARKRLAETNQSEQWLNRHLAHFVQFAEATEPHLDGPDQAAALSRFDSLYENVSAALDWSVRGGSALSGLRIAAAIWRYWDVRCLFSEGRNWCLRLLIMGGDQVPLDLRATVLNASGNLASRQCEYSAAQEMLSESLAIRWQLGDRRGIGSALNNLGLATSQRGDYPVAKAFFEQSVKIFRELDDPWRTSVALSNLGVTTYHHGDYDSARSIHEESLELSRQAGSQLGSALSLGNLGQVALKVRDFDSANRFYRESLALRWELRDRWGIALALEGIAQICAGCGDAVTAALIWGASERLRERIDSPLPLDVRAQYEESVAEARKGCEDPSAFEEAWRQGRALNTEQAVQTALEAGPH